MWLRVASMHAIVRHGHLAWPGLIRSSEDSAAVHAVVVVGHLFGALAMAVQAFVLSIRPVAQTAGAEQPVACAAQCELVVALANQKVANVLAAEQTAAGKKEQRCLILGQPVIVSLWHS
jgi:hypothetical protein